ncbi:MAG: HDOD domain-containing protein [Thermodesulfobacteriota bacterium]|nr:HDOD domain-containing protein [Thermodesulfobacteriota bacterium]
MATESSVQRVVLTAGDLPAMPHVASQVMTMVSNPDTTAQDLQRIISQDQSLVARVLKLANSSFYARSRSIATITEAVVVIGFRTIRSLVVASVTRDIFDNFGLTEKLLWEHSLGCGLAARTIAQSLRYSKTEEAFLAGLLHDVGKMILLIKFNDKMLSILEEVYNDPETSFVRMEQRLLGFDHAQVGQLLARKWQFAEEIEEAIGCHHAPARARLLPALTVIVHLANAFCHKLEIGPTKRPDLELSQVKSAKALKMSPAKIEDLLEEIRTIFAAEATTLFN